MNEREGFERWARHQWGDDAVANPPVTLQAAWLGWQARMLVEAAGSVDWTEDEWYQQVTKLVVEFGAANAAAFASQGDNDKRVASIEAGSRLLSHLVRHPRMEPLSRAQVTDLAIKHGFTFKLQADGSMALNAYVYDFADAIRRADAN